MGSSITKWEEIEEERQRIIAQNGNSGLHYGDEGYDVELSPTGTQLEFDLTQEVSNNDYGWIGKCEIYELNPKAVRSAKFIVPTLKLSNLQIANHGTLNDVQQELVDKGLFKIIEQ